MSVLLAAGNVAAADLYIPPEENLPPTGGWYLRGHLGMSNQRLGKMHHELFSVVELHEFSDKGGFDSAPTGGIGVGYKFNDHLRTDAIIEYRGKADFHALDRYGHMETEPVWDGTNDYTASKSELLLMANVYVDIGDFRGIIPYVGAGIGASRNTIHHFRDINVPMDSVAYADTDPSWNFAWALHAGFGYAVTDALTLDFGYSYLNLGNAKTNSIHTYDGVTTNSPMHFKDITSHDFKFGLRYALQ